MFQHNEVKSSSDSTHAYNSQKIQNTKQAENLLSLLKFQNVFQLIHGCKMEHPKSNRFLFPKSEWAEELNPCFVCFQYVDQKIDKLDHLDIKAAAVNGSLPKHIYKSN